MYYISVKMNLECRFGLGVQKARGLDEKLQRDRSETWGDDKSQILEGSGVE